jgi:hypothetical protein
MLLLLILLILLLLLVVACNSSIGNILVRCDENDDDVPKAAAAAGARCRFITELCQQQRLHEGEKLSAKSSSSRKSSRQTILLLATFIVRIAHMIMITVQSIFLKYPRSLALSLARLKFRLLAISPSLSRKRRRDACV